MDERPALTRVRARRCPNCAGLLSQDITGELKDPDFLVTCLECGRNAPAAAWALGEWRAAKLTSDPNDPGGQLVGEFDAFARDSILVDTRNAVLVDTVDVATTTLRSSDSQRGVAMQLAGRVNLTDRRSNVLYLMDENGCAALVAQITAIVVREGTDFQRAFEAALEAQLEAMPTPKENGDA